MDDGGDSTSDSSTTSPSPSSAPSTAPDAMAAIAMVGADVPVAANVAIAHSAAATHAGETLPATRARGSFRKEARKSFRERHNIPGYVVMYMIVSGVVANLALVVMGFRWFF